MTTVGQNAEALNIQDNKLRQMNGIPISGGLMPTKRDSAGNVLLYEDPENAGSQLDQPDQLISIPVVKPDYDDDQAVGVLDAQISELYKGRDITEIQRLRQQVEDLRQRLGLATAFSDDIELEEPTEREPLDNSRIPFVVKNIEDFAAGILSDSDLAFTVNTAIWDSDTQKLTNIGSPSEFPVLYYIIEKSSYTQPETGDSILADFSDGSNTLFTSYEVRKADSGFLSLIGERDVALLPDNTNLSNFYGWFYRDTSTGKENNWIPISTDIDFRFKLNRRRNSGNESIDQTINRYDFLLTFKDEAPQPPLIEYSTLNLQVAFVDTEQVSSTPFLSQFDNIRRDFFRVTLFDRATGDKVGVETYRNPRTLQLNRTTLKSAWVSFDRQLLPTEGVEGYKFQGWYELQGENWVRLEGAISTLPFELDFDERTIVAGYAFSDVPDSGVPDKDDPDISCFLKGTKILLANGTEKPIESISVGDLILSYDFDKKDLVSTSVLELESPIRSDYYIVEFENGKTLNMTNEHPLYSQHGWAAIIPSETKKESDLIVEKLNIGDEVLTSNNKWNRIVNITNVKENVQTYNLKGVEKYSNFFAEDALAHNKEAP